MLETHPLYRLLNWLRHEDRRPHLIYILNNHLLRAYEDYGVTLEGIEQLFGSDCAMTLVSWMLEDFLSHPVDPDCREMVDEYLKRRAWKDSPATRRYIEAVRRSHMSLYEVTDRLPGRVLEVRDLLRDAAPVRAIETSPERGFLIGDKVAARVITVAGRTILANGLLPLKPEVAEALRVSFLAEAEVVEATRRRAEEAGDAAEKFPRPDLVTGDNFLASCAGIFTQAWLAGVLPPAETLERDSGSSERPLA